jgi:hypothetical protein
MSEYLILYNFKLILKEIGIDATYYQEAFDAIFDKYEIYIDIYPKIVSAGEVSGYRYGFSITDVNNEHIIESEQFELLGYKNREQARIESLSKVIDYIKTKKP